MAGALQGSGNHALVLWASTGAVVGKDLSMRGHKTAKRLSVLVVNGANFVGTKVANLLDHFFIVIILRFHKFREGRGYRG